MKITSLIAISILVLTSCASTFQYNKIAQPSSNGAETATIYVIRPSYFGSAVKFGIYEDEKLVGKIGPKSYLAWTVEADGNALTVMSKSENKDRVTINPEPGKTYYMRQKAKMGVVVARTDLELVDEKEGQALLQELKAPKYKE